MTGSGPIDVRIPATDEFPLAGTVCVGRDDVERVALVAPATGVRREFYERFAGFLAGRGMGVVTWDWRGVGGSRPGSLRGFEATMREWAEKDLAGVVAWAAERWPGARLAAVGHSFGGQGFGLTPASRGFDRLVLVAAQSGYYGHWPAPRRYLYLLLWSVVVPGLTALYGYFPSRFLGLGEDLPAGVARQWARWCRSPDYLGDYSGHAALEVPLLGVSFTDDDYAPRGSVEAILARYRAATVTRRHLAPADVGRDRVGHFGFFKLGDSPLWREVATFLGGT